MNGQSNPFNFNRNPKPIPKRSGDSVADIKKTEEKTINKDNNLNQAPLSHKPDPILNPVNSDKMNQNPNNHKINSNSNQIPIGKIHGAEIKENEPLSPGMIQAEANVQTNRLNTTYDNEKQPSFSKALIGDMKNPSAAFINEEASSKEKIEPMDATNMGYNNPDDTVKTRKNIRKIIMMIILIGVVIEVIVLIVGAIIKNNKITYVTCTNSNQYEYYKAVIKSERKYSLKKDKIVKMEEKIDYVFSDSIQYLDYKKRYINPPFADIKGRAIITSINDDTLTYTEKIVYDYKLLLEKNKNEETNKDYIKISTSKPSDTINLVNSNVQGIKTYHADTYTCK